jgi:transcriptional regulator with XRE-family HTH domain
MDVRLLIRQRLAHLGLEQKDLAAAAEVTESYISQLLARRRMPPAPDRTDIYDKMSRRLELPPGRLAKLADLQRKEQLKRGLVDPPAPLFKEVRELILRKCPRAREAQIRGIFEKQPFGELERLVTQKLLDLAKGIAREELENEDWLHLVARLSHRTYADIRVLVLEFLDTDIYNVSVEDCVSYLDPLIESWDIDLGTFEMEVVLNRRLTPGHTRRFEFVEREPDRGGDEPGLTEFLGDPTLCRDASQEEIEFLKRLRFEGRRPTALYYYRELQNLRDPLLFHGSHPKRDPRRLRNGRIGRSPAPRGRTVPGSAGTRVGGGDRRGLR